MRLTPIDFPLILLVISFACVYWVHPIFLLISLFLLYDCVVRYVEYRNYRGTEWSIGVGRRFIRSRCKRGVACCIWPEAREYYASRGYRFYHIFPDGAPRCFFKRSFWMKFVRIA